MRNGSTTRIKVKVDETDQVPTQVDYPVPEQALQVYLHVSRSSDCTTKSHLPI